MFCGNALFSEASGLIPVLAGGAAGLTLERAVEDLDGVVSYDVRYMFEGDVSTVDIGQ